MDGTQGQFLYGVRLIWIQSFFFLLDCLTKDKEHSQPYYLLIVAWREREEELMTFLWVLAWREIQTASSRI